MVLCRVQIVQLLYFGYSVINDIFGSNTLPSEDQSVPNKSALRRFRDFIAASVVFPASLVILSLVDFSCVFIAFDLCE